MNEVFYIFKNIFKGITMKILLNAYVLMALSAAGADFQSYQPKTLNPVKITAIKNAKTLELIKNGKPLAVIIIPTKKNDVHIPGVMYCGKGPAPFDNKNTFAAAFAASELQKYIEKSTGARLPIITEENQLPEGMTPVFVGISSKAKSYGFTQDGIKPEGFRISNNGEAVGIIGAPKGKMGNYDGVAATVFGVYDFLERFLGTRFYYHGEEGVVVKKAKNLLIPGMQYQDYPRYNQRLAYSWTWKDKPDNIAQVSALRWRSGNHGWGSLPVFQHTPADLTVMFDKKNDIDCFQLNEDGKRSLTIPPVPCYGNPKTMNYLMQVYKGFYNNDSHVKKAIKHAYPNQYALGFGPPDHPVECHCKYCKQIPPDKTRHFWEQNSEFMGQFAEKLSRRIKNEFPGKRFYYLPYYNYSAPPKHGKFADNTYIRLCFMFGTLSYNDPYVQQKYREWVNGWIKASGHKISGYLYNWPDVEDNLDIPYQVYHAYKNFLSDMQDKVEGFFVCGLSRNIRCRLFSDYCLFRLMWNPEFDVDEAVNEMYHNLFGPAAPQMQEIYDCLTKNFDKCKASDFAKGLHGAPYTAPSFSQEEAFSLILSESDLQMMKKNVAIAEKAVKQAKPVYRQRLSYFIEPIKLIFKRHEFKKRRMNNSEKQLLAEPVGVESISFKIDGKLNEKTWSKAQTAEMERAEMVLGNSKTDVPTKIKILRYSSRNPAQCGLIIGMKMTEPKMSERFHNVHDKELYRGDCIEIFFDALPVDGKKSSNFLQYIVSSDGRLLYFDGRKLIPGKQLKCDYGIHQDKDFWSVELRIPYTELYRAIPLKKRAGIKCLKANFVRTRVLKNASGIVYKFLSRWRTNFTRNNHDINSFGDVIVWEDSALYGDTEQLSSTKTTQMPTIDGKFDEAAWKNATTYRMSSFPMSFSKKQPTVPMNFKVLRYDHPSDNKKSGLIFGFHMVEPRIKTAVLNVPDNQLHNADNLEVYIEMVPFSPYFMRYIFLMDGRATRFGNPKPDFKIHKGKDYWNLELFVPFKHIFSSYRPMPESWNEIPGVRFNLKRQRINREQGKAIEREESRWNVSTIKSPFNINSFGLMILNHKKLTNI